MCQALLSAKRLHSEQGQVSVLMEFIFIIIIFFFKPKSKVISDGTLTLT